MFEHPTREEMKQNVKNSSVWIRLLYMLLFALLYWAAEVVLLMVVLYQFLNLLLTGEKNSKVLAFGAQLSAYVYQVFRFLTFNSEEKPFPMADWPTSTLLQPVAAEDKAVEVVTEADVVTPTSTTMDNTDHPSSR